MTLKFISWAFFFLFLLFFFSSPQGLAEIGEMIADIPKLK